MNTNIAMQDTSPQFDSPVNALAKVLQIRDAQQGQQLHAMKMDEYRRGVEGDNTLAQLLAGGKTGADVATGLASKGYGKQAMAYTQQMQEAAKRQADTDKTTAEALDKNLSAFRSVVPQINTPEQAAQYAKAMYEHPILGKFAQQFGSLEDTMKRNAEAFATDPRKWVTASAGVTADKLMEMMKGTRQNTNIGNVNRGETINAYGEVVPGQTTTSVIGQSADNAATQATAIRGQNMTDSRARETLAQGKTPPGYRATPEGNLVAIPGGPADLKLQGALNQDTQALTGSISSMDRLATAANEVLNHPGLKGIYGLRGVVPNVPGTDAADAAALLQTLKSQVGFGVLQDMRNNSKTGGALGSVSDKENAMLQANLAALDKAQSVEQAMKSLKKIVEYTNGAKDRLRGAYNMKHNASSPTPAPTAAPSAGGAKFLGFE